MVLSNYIELFNLLSSLYKALVLFNETLEAENLALQNPGKAESIIRLVERKQTQLSELYSLENSFRNNPLIRIRSHQIEFLVEANSIDEEQILGQIQSTWKLICKLTVRCKELNMQNHALTHVRLRSTRSALEHLRILGGLPTLATYDQSGHTIHGVTKGSSSIRA